MNPRLSLLSVCVLLLLAALGLGTAYALAAQPIAAPQAIANDAFLDEQFGAPGAQLNVDAGGYAPISARWSANANGIYLVSLWTSYAGKFDNQYSQIWDKGGSLLHWDGQAWGRLPGKLWAMDQPPAAPDFLPAELLDVSTNAAGNVVVIGDTTITFGYADAALNRVEQPDGSLATLGGIALWDGSQWQTLDGGFDWACGASYAGDCHVALAENGDVYVYSNAAFNAGLDGSGTPITHAARWNGTQWQDISTGLLSLFFEATVRDLLIAPDGSPYLFGRFRASLFSSSVYLYRWDGTQWQAEISSDSVLPLPDDAVNGGGVGTISALAFDGSNLYFSMSGYFDDAQWQRQEFAAVYRRDNTGSITLLQPVFYQQAIYDNWDPNQTYDVGNVQVSALAVSTQGDLFAAGYFYHQNASGGVARSVARWDGSQWQPLGEGFDGARQALMNTIGGPYQAVYALAFAPDGNLHALGSFTHSGNTRLLYTAQWDGSQWQPVCDACNGLSRHGDYPTVYDIQPDADGSLWVAGQFDGAGSLYTSNLARWDTANLRWLPAGQGLTYTSTYGHSGYPYVAALAKLNGQWVAAGNFDSVGGAPLTHALAQWDQANQVWQPFAGGGLDDQWNSQDNHSYANALLADGDLLYVTGRFAQANATSLPASHYDRAVYNAATQTWSALAGAHDPDPYDNYFKDVQRIYKSPTQNTVYFSPGMVAWNGTDFAPSVRISYLGNDEYWLLGDFTSINGQPYGNLARYNNLSGEWENVGGGFTSPICADYTSIWGYGVVLCNDPTTFYTLRWDGVWQPIAVNVNDVYPSTAKPIAFYQNGDILMGIRNVWATPLPFSFFIWNENTKAITTLDFPPATTNGGALDLAGNNDGQTGAYLLLEYHDYNFDGPNSLQAFRFDRNSQTWQALTSPAVSASIDVLPIAVHSTGNYVYFGGTFQEFGDKISVAFARWGQPHADLSVTQQSQTLFGSVNQPLNFVLTVENAGPDPAPGVLLTDTLGGAATFVSAAPSQGGCNLLTGAAVTCQLGTIPVGQSALVTVTILPTAAGNITNTVQIAAPVLDPDASNNTSMETLAIGDFADLTVARTQSPLPALTETPLDLWWVLQNQGGAPAFSVSLTDTLPISGVLGSLLTPQGECLLWLGTLRCDVGTLNAGQTLTVTAVFTPYAALTYTDNAQVATVSLESDLTNNVMSHTLQIAQRQTDLQIGLTAPVTLAPTAALTYTVNITNAGWQAAPQSAAVINLPIGALLNGFSASQGTCSGTQTITCTLGTLAGGQVVHITLNTTPSQFGTLNARASVNSANPESNPLDNVAVASTQHAAQADLWLEKGATPLGVTPGITQTYMLWVGNLGPHPAFEVLLTDTLPGGAQFVTATLPGGVCNANGQAVTCSLFQLDAGAQTQAIVTATLVQTVTQPNTAVVASASLDPNLSNNTAQIALNAATLPDFSVSITGTMDEVQVGSLMQYTVTVTNRGEVTTTALLYSYGNTSLTAETAGGSCTMYTCTLNALPPGAATVVYVSAATPQEGAFYAVHSVIPADGDSAPADNVASAVWHGTVFTDLQVRLGVQPALPAVGATYTVEIGVQNAGVFAAQGITVTYGVPLSSTLVSLPGACSAAGSAITCGIGQLLAGEVLTFTFGWQTAQPLDAQHTAFVLAHTPEQNTANNFALLQIAVGAADTGLEGAPADASAQTGESFIYNVQVLNRGAQTVDSAQFVLLLPQSAVLTGQSGAACTTQADAGQGLLLAVCSLNPLQAGSAQEIALTLQFSAEGSYDLLAVLQHSLPDVNWLDNSTITALTVSTGENDSRRLFLPIIFR